jgi:hypothetical protein
LDPLQAKADEIIDRAGATGNSFARTVGEEIRSSIEAWRKANSSLLNQAFSRLDEQQRKLFNDMQNVLDQLSQNETALMSDVQRVSSEIAVMEKNLPFTNHDPEMWDYKPRVVLPVGNNVIAVRVVGPKLSLANPDLHTAKQPQSLEIDKTSDNDLVANLPRSSLQFTDDGSNYAKYNFSFEVSRSQWWNPLSWGKVEKRERALVLWALPKTMAHYVISPTITTSKPTESMTFPADVSPHGKDSTFKSSVTVPPDLVDKGWVIDTEALLKTAWGNPAQTGDSKCGGVDRDSIKPTGFLYNVVLGHETDRAGHKSDGMCECSADVPLMRTLTVTGAGYPLEGDLTWTDDANVKLPDGTQQYEISLKMFDGRSYIITDDANVPFGVVKISRQGNAAVLFRPRPPSDF